MLILTLKTSEPESQLCLYDGTVLLEDYGWNAHRTLSSSLYKQVDELLERHGKTLSDVNGFVCFKGPGSFTGLRIGLAAINGLSYAKQLPVVAAGGEDWRREGINMLLAGRDEKVAVPVYGRPARVTIQKK